MSGARASTAALRVRKTVVASMSLGVWLAIASGCIAPPARRPPPLRIEPIRLIEVAHVGDPARRASIRLVISGVDHDIDGDPMRAVGSYERALQVDPTNPYAWLALARHAVQRGNPEGALEYLEQAESFFRGEREFSPRAGVHLIGLRGWALYEGGAVEEGSALLAQASADAPETWGDGRLSALELR